MSSPALFDTGFAKFVGKYNEPASDFNINVARLFVCSFFIWKLLSRDFGFFGNIPRNIFYFYPNQLYDRTSYTYWTGLPGLTDLLTFHWVHWFIPHPNEFTLRAIQGMAIGSLILLAIVGRGPKKSILAFTYCILVYLWGYLFLLGQEIDAIDLYFGLLLALFISDYRDVPLWDLGALYHSPKTLEGGRSYSNLILVFVFYYFASGMKKLTDISPLEWFQYDLIDAIHVHYLRASTGLYGALGIFRYLHGMTWLDYIGPPLVYMSHLLSPTVFFRRQSIPSFFLFYAVFHLLTFGVGISFTGYIFVWSAIFPHREIIAGIAKGLRDVPVRRPS